MPILKNKIAKVLEIYNKTERPVNQENNLEKETEKAQDLPRLINLRPKRPNKSAFQTIHVSSKPKGSTSCKNIMKNYSRALTNFALTKYAEPYLTKILETHKVDLTAFQKFIRENRKQVNCIKNLRELLLADDHDSGEVAGLKNVFKEISIVFMKYFCVNWIYHGKVMDRQAHLKYRFKILRRIQNPIFFTYLEDFAR